MERCKKPQVSKLTLKSGGKKANQTFLHVLFETVALPGCPASWFCSFFCQFLYIVYVKIMQIHPLPFLIGLLPAVKWQLPRPCTMSALQR